MNTFLNGVFCLFHAIVRSLDAISSAVAQILVEVYRLFCLIIQKQNKRVKIKCEFYFLYISIYVW